MTKKEKLERIQNFMEDLRGMALEIQHVWSLSEDGLEHRYSSSIHSIQCTLGILQILLDEVKRI